MDLVTSSISQFRIIEVKGDLDIYNANKLKILFSELLLEGDTKFILSLEHLSNIDSSGIGVLIHLFSVAREKDVNLCMAHLGPAVMKTIRNSRLEDYFTIVETVRDGMQKIIS